MTDKPIPFSPPMVRANNEGRKTQTRRVHNKLVGFQFGPKFTEFGESDTKGFDWHFRDKDMRWHDVEHDKLLSLLPYQVGDRLWVREAWCPCGQMNKFSPSEVSKFEPVGYLADGDIRVSACEMVTRGRTRASMHMPRWASRTTLIVTDVRVQRVQDISEADAEAEGADRTTAQAIFSPEELEAIAPYEILAPDAVNWIIFGEIWDSINEKRGFGWDKNPWVVAYTFTTHKSNIDQLEMPA